jgi:hypothetical protein
MQAARDATKRPTENSKTFRYNHQTFRPEAVEAYTTRQAGEAWDAKHRLEAWIIAGLTIAAAAATTFMFLGAR